MLAVVIAEPVGPPPMPPPIVGGVKLDCPQAFVPAAAAAALSILMVKSSLKLLVALPVVAPPRLPDPVSLLGQLSSHALLLLFR